MVCYVNKYLIMSDKILNQNRNNKIEKYFQKALVLIEENKLLFVEDVVAYLGISRTTIYDYFPLNSDRMNTIKSLLDNNKINLKIELRSKMFISNNPTMTLALYKLICSDEERKLLSMNYTEISGQISTETSSLIDYSKLSTETLRDIMNSVKNN